MILGIFSPFHFAKIDPMTLALPHLNGMTMSELKGESLQMASVAAFGELGRFHRINEWMIHGDPHAGKANAATLLR